jgi:hypothetical protein
LEGPHNPSEKIIEFAHPFFITKIGSFYSKKKGIEYRCYAVFLYVRKIDQDFYGEELYSIINCKNFKLKSN